MSAANHPAYKEELERCRYTLDYVEKSLKKALEKREKIGNELESVQKHMSGDSSADYTSIMVNTMLHDTLALKVKNLYTARGKPYFARVDYKENDSDRTEKLYIGKMSLSRDEDQEIVIVDWRAPIANLYYEGRLGPSSYECPDGIINGELLLKRQFSINNGSLDEIFDIDITTNDEFLQTYLGANAENRLKEIVSTIQEEQNKIVRAPMWKPLIVQGVAGSGKTTIALHRIAYLIYTFEKSFDPENFMIIAPNRLFLNYISEVLPELGVDRVKQTTFEEFSMELIGKKFKLRDANEKLNMFVNHNVTEEQIMHNNLVRGSSILKTSMDFKDIIDEYLKEIELSFIPKKDITLGTKVIFSYEELNNLFLTQYGMWPIAQRMNEIKKSIKTRLKTSKDQFIQQIHAECDKKVARARAGIADASERQRCILEAFEKRDRVLEKIEKAAKSLIKDYVASLPKLSPYQYYVDLMKNTEVFNRIVAKYTDEETCKFIREYTLDILNSGGIEQEDLAPIIYLKYKVYGMDEKIPVRHIVIDEAQDFSAFQFYVMKKIVKDSSFTILGDLCQGIHFYRGVRNWDEVVNNVFEGKKCEFLTLEQSYRTTVEIMEAANNVMEKLDNKDLVRAKPVIRHGEPVEYIQKNDISDVAADIVEKIEQAKKLGHKTIAVICKTMEECSQILPMIKKADKNISIITGNEKEYKSGIVVVPSYLSKGLEFDVVLISNASSEYYTKSDLDIKLLYVAMTRPLHKLCIYHTGEISNLLR
ncbi:UvrD/REP helicase [Ruminiclostridium papyrosolvens DSM 2782]|uniref:DNA 3'-5' helicase n=1 Tax=Ruminiclostridium papyrosolvens DSM 2782 TaxID=588581 RepID=F1TAW9_9FIRM|nr:RNA polymerase recycling motor HelD [Ruminiclostridium papyrosolvens]EGD48173.1 UvrD/REP helicase [Ruminiclostridium papyrosolvens DSM 2782]WES34314.1 RNA polymerase recycling motor HelD [Ruminiclostridium papyrosolvens DSM 2782]